MKIIGVVGHVDHGKTTLVKAISGILTDKHSEEIKRGISIKLGYANVLLDNEEVSFSLIDVPGHETLIATMMSGASMMAGAILLISANESCPQPQTKEHLKILSLLNINKIIIVQNKIDIVTKDEAISNFKQIKKFIKGTIAENSPIIPLSALHDININILHKEIINHILSNTNYDKKIDEDPIFYVARSFDINKPGTPYYKLSGGVIGGSLLKGKIKLNDTIEISPGLKYTKANKTYWNKITTQVISLKTGNKKLSEITPGCLFSIGTTLDPFLTKSDSLVGKVIGKLGKTPPILTNITVKFKYLDDILNNEEGFTSKNKLFISDLVVINVSTATTTGIIQTIKRETISIVLKIPICAVENQNVVISKRIDNRWVITGYGPIL